MKKGFMYREEVWSLYNKTFNIGTVVFFVLALLGCYASEMESSKYVLLLFGVGYLGFVGWTLYLYFRNKSRRRNGLKCRGLIVEELLKNEYVGEWNTAKYRKQRRVTIYLSVEYENPQTGQRYRFRTPAVNKEPYTYLSSLAVTVYVLPDGSAWATDFQRIKDPQDAVKYKIPGCEERVRAIKDL